MGSRVKRKKEEKLGAGEVVGLVGFGFWFFFQSKCIHL